MLDNIDARYPGNTQANRIRAEIQDQLRLAAEAEEVQSLLANARRQMGEDKLIEPAGDNALESFTDVLTIRSDNADAEAGLNDIAAIYTQRAQAASTLPSIKAAMAKEKAIEKPT